MTKKKRKKNLKQKITIKNRDIFLFPYKVESVISTLSQSQGWGIKELNVPDTWKITKGKGIKVMVIDTGFTDHPDLAGALEVSACKSFLAYEPVVEDKNGHSTHVCGIVGARDNDIGMVGVAPECTIITTKVLGSDGSGDYFGIKRALAYAKEVKPDVVNMSLGSCADEPEMHQLITDLYNMNIPVVAAAGNDGQGNSVNYPGKYPEVICVTAFDQDGNPADFNSTGPETEFSAPGVDIYSTWLNHSYARLSGTSMATPFMTGVVALLLAKHRKQEAETGQNDCKTVAQIVEHLKKYADDKGVLGRDPVWGYGVVDVDKLITDENGTTTPTVTTQEVPPIVTTTTTTTATPKESWFQRLLRLLKNLRGIFS